MQNWQAGEAITAEKLNQVNRDTEARLSPIENNVLQLFLENYFASKITPAQGLIFDGFSDGNKADAGAGSPGVGTAGQTSLVVGNVTSAFHNGDDIHIYDATNQEVRRIVSQVDNTAVEATRISQTAQNVWTAQIVSGQSHYETFIPRDISRITKASVRLSGPGGGYSVDIWLKIYDSTGSTMLAQKQITTTGWSGTQDFTVTLDTPLAVSIGTTYRVYVVNNAVYGCLVGYQNTDVYADGTFSGGAGDMYFTIQGYGINTLTITPALTNSYTGATVKGTSATIDTANKQLTMTAGVGNLKKSIYQTTDMTFSQLMRNAHLWVMRTPTKINLAATVANLATALTYKGYVAPATNDFIDIVSAAKKTRERKTVSSASIGSLSNVVVDATGGGTASSTSITQSHTIGAGSNRLLVVCVYGPNTITGATFAGQNMTLLGAGPYSSFSYIYYMVNPPTGANNIVMTFASTGGINLVRASFANVDQTTPISYTMGVHSTPSAVTSRTATINSSITQHMLMSVLGNAGGISSVSASGYAAAFGQSTIYAATKQAAAGVNDANWSWATAAVAQAAQLLINAVSATVTVNFTPAITAAAGYGTSDTVERVDVAPKISIVDASASNAAAAMTYVESSEVTVDAATYVEDHYTYAPGTAANKIKALLEFTRMDILQNPTIKRLGIALTT